MSVEDKNKPTTAAAVTKHYVDDIVGSDLHQHVDKNGFIVDCYHSTKNVLLSASFWIGVTFSFPIEHYIWEKVWPFYLLHDLMGL